jgi:hypothetical protein
MKTIERKPFAHIIQALRAANNLGANKPTQKSDDEDDEKTEAEDEQEEGDLDKPVKKKKSKPAIEDQERRQRRRRERRAQAEEPFTGSSTSDRPANRSCRRKTPRPGSA